MLTLLSTLLTRMNRWQTIAKIEEQFKVLDLDESIRDIRRATQLPWMLKKSTIRVFDGVLTYPVAADHDYLAYIDTQQANNVLTSSQGNYSERLRARYTSLEQFYEDLDNRNTIAEIWDTNARYLGIRDKIIQSPSSLVDGATSITNYTASQDANSIALDQVFFLEGSSSIRFNVTPVLNLATVTLNPFTNIISDLNYKAKYFFLNLFLGTAPTSIDLKFGDDAGNYLTATVTTQFSGQAFKVGDWNVLAFDLNTALVVGVINPNAFNYWAFTMVNAGAGFYYIDTSYLRQWQLLDYWYYSKFMVQTIAATIPDQEFFNDITLTYKLDSSLIGESEWTDVVMYEALVKGFLDRENVTALPQIIKEKDDAWQKLYETYPSMKPLITTQKFRFETDFNGGDGNFSW